MLYFFKNKRRLRLLTLENMVSHYLAVLKELTSEELARGLDMAADIKYDSLRYEEVNTDYWNAFNTPVLVNVKTAEKIQIHWVEKINHAHETESHQSRIYALGMSIWSHSLLTAAYPELRQQGLTLWNELQRGFKFCERFNPQKDIPEII